MARRPRWRSTGLLPSWILHRIGRTPAFPGGTHHVSPAGTGPSMGLAALSQRAALGLDPTVLNVFAFPSLLHLRLPILALRMRRSQPQKNNGSYATRVCRC